MSSAARNGLLIAETFSMVYPNEEKTVEHAEIMNAVTSITAKLVSYRNCLIAIDLPKHPAFISALLGILESGNVFVCCSKNDNATAKSLSFHTAKVSCIISSSAGENMERSVRIHGVKVYFHHKGYHCLDAYRDDGLCYLIATSGTLGQRKEVLVPYSCIMPNIWDFSRRFRITASDVILFATAVTFDPFVVEIFLAVINGAKLLIVPDSVRSIPAKLSDLIIEHNATFIQMTPSQLKILPHTFLMEIFAGRTAVRTVIVGGEAFPIHFLRRYHIDARVEFYNVYGITEISCWASCHKIDWSETRVEIGEPLLETKFDVTDNGELLIGGSRHCFINGKLSEDWFHTGDTVDVEERGKIYWCERSDDLQKINGIKVSLSDLARQAERSADVKSALALRRGQSVLLFVHSINDAIQSDLSEKLSAVGLLLIVITVDTWPITENGKIDRQKLMQIFEQKSLIFTMEDLSKLFASFGINLENDQQMTFKEFGLRSLQAVELTVRTEHLLKQHDFSLLQYLLSDVGTIAGFLDVLNFDQSTFKNNITHAVQETRIKPIQNFNETHLEWAYNLGKCIDATPIIENGCIFLGSHSGRFVSLFLDGTKHWEIQLGGRIEATACCQSGIIAVGCYDGYIYFLDEKSGQLIWKFGTGDIIKSIPVLIDDGKKCFFGSHDKYLYSLDVRGQKLLWKVNCDGSILSSPKIIAETIMCGTLKGEVLALQLDTGEVLWKVRLAAPIFANLCPVNSDRALLVDVRGMLHQYDVKESVFATPVLFPDKTNSTTIIVTQTASVFLLQIDTLQLIRHIRVDGMESFPRTPHVLDNGLVFIQDSSGFLLVIRGMKNMLQGGAEIMEPETSTLTVIAVLKVPSKTFAGVKILKCEEADERQISNVSYRALIGSRDDRIRCFCFSLTEKEDAVAVAAAAEEEEEENGKGEKIQKFC